MRFASEMAICRRGFKNGRLKDELDRFAAADQIMILKKTKKSEKEVDIRPMIYKLEFTVNGFLCSWLQAACLI